MRREPHVSGHIDHKARARRLIEQARERAREQWGVISLEQLLIIGFSYDEIRTLVRRGHLIRLYRGVFAVGQLPQLTKGYLKGALLTAGEGAFLGRRTATAAWGARDVAIRRIEVNVRARRQSRDGLIFHEASRVDPADVIIRNDLRVSSFPWMLIELSPQETSRELERLITFGIRKNFLNLDEMRLALRRHRGHRGLAKLKTALAGYLPTHDRKSDLERAFDAFLRAHPEIPEPERNIYIGGWEIDCYWPEQKLAVELDGRPYHITVRDIEKDKLKDAKLLAIDIRTLRITDARFEHDVGGVYTDLLAALGLS